MARIVEDSKKVFLFIRRIVSILVSSVNRSELNASIWKSWTVYTVVANFLRNHDADFLDARQGRRTVPGARRMVGPFFMLVPSLVFLG